MIRFSTWAAVSTIDQVEGASLDNQIDKCTERGQSEGWYNTGLVYVADGYSRTGYVNLSDAEKDIPPLGKMLADLRAGLFDVLILWNYDRLGDLILMVATEFRNHKKQLFSLSQPTQIQKEYNPYMDDTSFIMQALAPVWQKQRIADLRRKYEAGIPKRVRDGLHPSRPPFAYRITQKGAPCEIIPAESALIRDMARLYMEGHSLSHIAEYCNKSGIRTLRAKSWSKTMIGDILRNPFYVGVVQWRKVSRIDKKLVPNPISKRVIGEGKHKPVFTLDEFEKIQAEFRRRAGRNQKVQVKYPFTGLLFCGHCGQKMTRSGQGKYYYISEHDRQCQSHHYDKIVTAIAEKIQAESYRRRAPVKRESKKIDFTDEIADILQRIERVQTAAELGTYTPNEAAKRVNELRLKLDEIETRKLDLEQAERGRAQFDMLDNMAEWILNDEPRTVNLLLHSVIQKITLFRDARIEILWR